LKEQEEPVPSKRKNKGVRKDKYTPHDFKEKTKKKVVVESDEIISWWSHGRRLLRVGEGSVEESRCLVRFYAI
jgi:hypothetical protein